MNDYSKLSKEQLVAILESIDRQLDGCIEDAERMAEEYVPEVENNFVEQFGRPGYTSKYPILTAILKNKIEGLKDDLDRWGFELIPRSTDGIMADYYTVQEFASYCNVDEGTVRQWIRRGKIIGAQKIGVNWFIPKSQRKPTRKAYRKEMNVDA